MKSIFTTLATAASVATLSSACSDFLLNATSPDNILSGRTMDFEADLKTVVEVIPANTSFQELPVFNCVECSDYQWKNKYGFVAFNMFGMNVASDGLNERGLSAAWLYLTATEYPSPQSTPDNVKDPSKPIITSVVSYLLGNYASVDEVRAGLDTFQIAEFDERIEVPLLHDTSLGRVPLHVSVHDAFGKSLVIEFIKGQTKIYDNINDVLTNDPPLDEQLNALLANGYTNIPGGYGSVERFLRVSVLNHAVQSGYSNAVVGKSSYTIGTDEQRAVSDVVHILNTVIRPPLTEATEWNVVRDHKRRKLYIQSTQNMVLRLIDLNQLNFAEGVENRKYIPITYGDWFVDVTSALKSPYNTAKTIDLPPRTQLEQLLEQILHGGIPPATQSLSAEHHSASSSSTASFALGMLSGVAVAVVVMSLSQVVMRARRRGAYMRIPEPDEVRV